MACSFSPSSVWSLGTILVYIDSDLLYKLADFESGTRALPPDLTQLIVKDLKIQDAAIVLFTVTTVSVKISFLFFFQTHLQQIKSLTIFWWVVLVLHVPTAVFLVCAGFISCPKFEAHGLLVKISWSISSCIETDL